MQSKESGGRIAEEETTGAILSNNDERSFFHCDRENNLPHVKKCPAALQKSRSSGYFYGKYLRAKLQGIKMRESRSKLEPLVLEYHEREYYHPRPFSRKLRVRKRGEKERVREKKTYEEKDIEELEEKKVRN